MRIILLILLPPVIWAQCYTTDIYDSARELCYAVPDKSLNWNDASKYCRGFGYELVSIHSKDQDDFINNTVLNSYPFRYQGYFLGGYRSSSSSYFRWNDGSSWDYSNWERGEPFYNYAIKMPSGIWETKNTYDMNYFICSTPTNSSNSTRNPLAATTTTNQPTQWGWLITTQSSISYPYSQPSTPWGVRTTYPYWPRSSQPSTTSYPYWQKSTQPPTPDNSNACCPSGWTFFEQTKACYQAKFGSNWNSAELLCNEFGAHLTSIHSYAENAFVAGLTYTHMDATAQNQMTWIGLNYEGGYWKWSDGSSINFIDFAPKEPRNTDSMQCAMLAQDSSQQNWQTFECDSQMRAFVCKKPIR